MCNDTPLKDLTLGQLLNILNEHTPPQNQLIYGISGLAKLLNCSTVTAQSIKNSGAIPYVQSGRKIVFKVDEVLNSLKK